MVACVVLTFTDNSPLHQILLGEVPPNGGSSRQEDLQTLFLQASLRSSPTFLFRSLCKKGKKPFTFGRCSFWADQVVSFGEFGSRLMSFIQRDGMSHVAPLPRAASAPMLQNGQMESSLDELESLISFNFDSPDQKDRKGAEGESAGSATVETEELRKRRDILAQELLAEGLTTPRWLREKEMVKKVKAEDDGPLARSCDDLRSLGKRDKPNGVVSKDKSKRGESDNSNDKAKKPQKITKSKSHAWILLKKQEEKERKSKNAQDTNGGKRKSRWLSVRSRKNDDNDKVDLGPPVEEGSPNIVMISARHVGTFKGKY